MSVGCANQEVLVPRWMATQPRKKGGVAMCGCHECGGTSVRLVAETTGLAPLINVTVIFNRGLH